MYKVLIPQDVPESGKAYLRERGYELVMGSGFDSETIKREIADADAVIARTALYPADVIRAGKKLKIISRHGIGVDNIDVKAAEEAGIYVTVTKNQHTSYAVAEHAMTMMMVLAKKIPIFSTCIEQGNWNARLSYLTNELYGKTLGLIGCGAIGLHLAKMLHDGMDMRVIGFDAYADPEKLPSYVELTPDKEEIFRNGDFISLHVPLTPDTKNMVGRAELKMMKPSAFLVNCARGGIVDEQALYEALTSHTIAGAGCDCFEQEPLAADHPLLKLKNFVSTPHNAGMSQEAQDVSGLISAQAVDDVLNGRTPQFPVNHPEKP